MMLTLFGYPRTRSLRVSWLLEELGLEWRYQLVNFATGDHKAPDFLQLSPQGKVPVLTDDELVISESAAICLYLAERYGQAQWLPQPGTPASALHHKWVSFIVTELEQPLWTIGKHKFVLPEQIRLPEVLPVATWEFKKAIKTAEHWLPEQGYLTGNKVAVADILLAHTLNWAVRFEQSLPEKLENYRQMMSKRPALKQALNKEMNALDLV